MKVFSIAKGFYRLSKHVPSELSKVLNRFSRRTSAKLHPSSSSSSHDVIKRASTIRH